MHEGQFFCSSTLPGGYLYPLKISAGLVYILFFLHLWNPTCISNGQKTVLSSASSVSSILDDCLKLINGIGYRSRSIYNAGHYRKERKKKMGDNLVALRCTICLISVSSAFLSKTTFSFPRVSLGATRSTVAWSHSYQSFASFLYSPSSPD